MVEMREMREGDRLFVRVYVERTVYRWRNSKDEPLEFANLLTQAWFDEGTVVIRIEATHGGEAPFFKGDHDPTGTTIRTGVVKSAAIRLAIAAHDHAHEQLRPGLPEKAERFA